MEEDAADERQERSTSQAHRAHAFELLSLAFAEFAAAEREGQEPPTPPEPDSDSGRLLSKKELATTLGKSAASIDRFDREGAPHSYVGDTKRYDGGAYRDWLTARGKRPTQAVKRVESTVDIDDVLVDAGLRVGAQ